MKELLKLSDEELLKHERVRRAYWCLVHDAKCVLIHKTVQDPDVTIYQAAFEMRDACIGMDIKGIPMRWNYILGCITGGNDTHNLLLSEPKEWIVAATLAWEESQKGD